jgi:hypothetical protein
VSELLRCGLSYPHNCELWISYKTCCRKNISYRICGQLLRFPNVRNCSVSVLNRIRNNVVPSLRAGGAVFDSGGGRIFYSPNRPDRLCGPSSLVFNRYRGFFLRE